MAAPEHVELVAQAIRCAFLRRQGGKAGREWDVVPEQVRESFRLEAAAAIEAYERARAA